MHENPTVMGSHYGLSDSHLIVGGLTHKYLRMYTYEYISRVKSFKEYKDYLEHDKNYNFIDIMFRNEFMRQDLLNRASDLGLTFQEMEKAIANRPSRSSTSSKHLPYKEYYDNECIQWVMEKEKLIIEKYNYRFE